VKTMSGAPTAVFDFDLTLTPWDTAGRYFGWLLRRSPWKMLAGAPVALLLSPLAAFHRTRKGIIRGAVWWATFGYDHEQLRGLAKLHVAEVKAREGSFLRKDGRRQIASHQAQGHNVVIATGALEILVCEILNAEDIRQVSVVGSSMRRFLGGMVARQHCYGAPKITMLRERGFEPPWAFVYSDHEADLPLLRAGATQFVVNPKPGTAAQVLAELGSSACVVNWR
jgi:phosphatidylglycerophosphatase C